MTTPLHSGDPAELGAYHLLGRLGTGGMGHVFLGRSRSGRLVAVKAVRPELADDADFRRRFATEVAAARKVGGFYTAQVVDADPQGDPPWMATAYIPGPSLHRAVSEHGPLPQTSVAVLGAGLAEGLTAVHAQGLVHRDLKPANVILAEDGPRLIDFGIARVLDSTSHTHTSTVLGTAAFMSPEQARAQKVGPPSDVFSLGCLLAFAATGRSPFGQGPSHAVAYRIVHEGPDLSGLPESLARIVGACLAKVPNERPGLETLLDQLSTLTVSGEESGQGRWLPDDFTEVIGQHRTLTLTAVQTPTRNARPEQPREQAQPAPIKGSGRSLAEERARSLGWNKHPAGAYQKAVYVLLCLYALVSVTTVIHQVVATSSLNKVLSEEPSWYNDALHNTINGLQAAVGVALMVIWVSWFLRVRTTAEVFEPGRLRYSPNMAVIGWLIPLGSLWLPKMIANDIWHASSPPGRDGRMVSAGLLHTWWVLWLATFLTWPLFFGPWFASVRTNVAPAGDSDSINRIFYFEFDLLFWVSMATHVLAVPAAIAAALFVRRLTAMQAARLSETRAAAPEGSRAH